MLEEAWCNVFLYRIQFISIYESQCIIPLKINISLLYSTEIMIQNFLLLFIDVVFVVVVVFAWVFVCDFSFLIFHSVFVFLHMYHKCDVLFVL